MVFLNSGLVSRGIPLCFLVFLNVLLLIPIYPCVGFFGMDIRSCIINLRLGWSMGFSKILMKSFSLRGNCKFSLFFFSLFVVSLSAISFFLMWPLVVLVIY